MPTPATPLRLQVIERICTVLQAIIAGANYWYTPDSGAVIKRMMVLEQVVHFPTYMVFSGAAEGKIELSGAAGDDSEYTEDFVVTIKGIVKDSLDTVTPLERCLADVRKAVDADSRSKIAGTLGALCVQCRIEDSAWTDDGEFSIWGFGAFSQKVLISIAGPMGV
jgi:hypothetical protein